VRRRIKFIGHSISSEPKRKAIPTRSRLKEGRFVAEERNGAWVVQFTYRNLLHVRCRRLSTRLRRESDCKARRVPFGRSKRLQGPLDESIFSSRRRRRTLHRMSTISTTSGPPAKFRNRSHHLRFEGFHGLERIPSISFFAQESFIRRRSAQQRGEHYCPPPVASLRWDQASRIATISNERGSTTMIWSRTRMNSYPRQSG
jgi:hypothetical protein